MLTLPLARATISVLSAFASVSTKSKREKKMTTNFHLIENEERENNELFAIPSVSTGGALNKSIAFLYSP